MQVTGNNHIDFSKSEQYTLSIRLSTDGFSFSIYNPMNNGSLSVFDSEITPSLSVTANLKQFIRETEGLLLPYRRINILIAGNRFTSVPLEWFEEEQAETLFLYNLPKKENEVILHNLLRRNNISVLFGMDKSTHSFLKEQYPDARFFSQISSLCEYFSTKSRLGNSKKMYVSLRPAAMEIFCYERGHLLLVNSFDCQQLEDRIFYLLHVWKQLEFDQERDELHLTGGMPADKDSFIRELRKYILQVFIMNPENNIDMQALLTCE